jgi:RimJ/RimL family protein N-acetyltransferase
VSVTVADIAAGSGFVQEGIKRRARFCDGRWGDIILMSILEDEFFAKDLEKARI